MAARRAEWILSNPEAKRFSCGLVGLKGEIAARLLHRLARDPRPAGCEPASNTSQYKWNLGIGWYEEIRDSGTNFFFERLPVGEYPFKYRIRAAVVGTFKAAPATVQPMYAPEFTAYSAGSLVTIQAVQ